MEADKIPQPDAKERIIALNKYIFGGNIRVIDTTASQTADIVEMPLPDTGYADAS